MQRPEKQFRAQVSAFHEVDTLDLIALVALDGSCHNTHALEPREHSLGQIVSVNVL